jgi:SNF2-related domain/Helicase conserved C-terminal domain
MARSVAQFTSAASFKSKALKRPRSSEQCEIHEAALEWTLQDSALVSSGSDLKSEPRWRDDVVLHSHYITNLITFCRRLPALLFADQIGSNNTISAGLIASELIARAKVSKVLIVCPKILAPQWCRTLESKFHIPARIAVGRDLIFAEPEDVGAVITTYHSAWMYLDQIPDNRFDMLVLDEAHKLCGLSVNNVSSSVIAPFREALEKRRFRYALMMTARPIQNGLWDLYSLLDLLAVARGQVNPFGSTSRFARRFIADDRREGSELNIDAHEDLRSIAHQHMSRVSREDAKLYFHDRILKPLYVDPTEKDLGLIQLLAAPILKLDPTAQVSLLLALMSSSNALLAELSTLAKSGYVTERLVETVRNYISRMPLSPKLEGLTTLIDQLRVSSPDRWRLVVFTNRVETQRRIQTYLEAREIAVGTINGEMSPESEAALTNFRRVRPDVHVLVCTETESEALNLPVATILNYDLPFDPFVVEQRISQVQRPSSNHSRLNIFNIALRGTFEERIVSRLQGRLQSLSREMGDVEPLLCAAGIIGDDDADVGFDETILQLVRASLAGEDIEATVHKLDQNIVTAKAQLGREEQNNDAVLGFMGSGEKAWPRAPSLPPTVRSMDARTFAIRALYSLGGRLTPQENGIYLCERDGARELMRFEAAEGNADPNVSLCAPGGSAFGQLANEVSSTGIQIIDDLDQKAEKQASDVAARWVSEFGASFLRVELLDVRRAFDGVALVLVHAATAYDSCDRLLHFSCAGSKHHVWSGRKGLAPLPDVIHDASLAGVNTEVLLESARKDPSIGEFCRFYAARRPQEVSGGGADEDKRKKLTAEFTPELELTLVELRGSLCRDLKLRVHYRWDEKTRYSSILTIAPRDGVILEAPPFELCSATKQLFPADCLGRCEITGVTVLKHYLVRSHISDRLALPENTVVCSLSKQRILLDEADYSEATGRLVASSLLKTSAISGKIAEPGEFEQCEFTGVDALRSELGVSEISGRRYRLDEQLLSVVSGKRGHNSEFILCDVTQQPFAPDEGANCDITGLLVDPSILKRCDVSGKSVIPSELERCAASGKWALKKYLVTSSVSSARVLERYALRSATGEVCAPLEGKRCMWSGRNYHPDDLRTCSLTGVLVHAKYVTSDAGARLQPLTDLLHGVRRTADASALWDSIAAKASVVLGGGRCRLEAAQTSPDGQYLAACSEVRSKMGRSVQHVGLIYSFSHNEIVGRLALGKRSAKGWTRAEG